MRLFLLFVIFSCSLTAAEPVPLGAGSYLRGLPQGVKGPDVTPRRSRAMRGPVPTNDWCSAAFWSDKSFPQFPHPLAVKAEAAGLRVALPKVHGTKNDIMGVIPGGNEDLVIGHSAAEQFAPPVVDSVSDWFISLLFEAGAARLRVSYGHGSPFVFAQYEGGAPRLSFAAAPMIWSGGEGDPVLGVTIEGKHYGIFAPAGSKWEGLQSAQWTCKTENTYFSVAALPDRKPETLALFANVAHCHVTNTEVRWQYQPSSSEVTTEFRFTTKVWEGSGKGTIFALYPHQWRNCNAPLLPLQYASVRGAMKLGAGESFITTMKYPGILPALPVSSTLPPEQLSAMIADDAGPLGDPRDTYWEGKQLGRLATLLGVADAAGLASEAARIHEQLASRLEAWFTARPGENKEVFAYEESWGTVIGYPASYGSDDQLNDHHFHYGYFIRAAAEIARRDPAWAADERWGSMVRLLIRDIAAPNRGDSLFPFLRTFDHYAGHTWASGHARFGDGNNNESSSEALNAWAGIVLFGEATGDKPLRDLGVWLFTTELHAVEENWFDVHGDNFAEGYTHPVVTMVWGGKGVHGTWFSANPEAIYGINWLPFTAASVYLGRFPRHAEVSYRSLLAENLADDRAKAAKSGKPAPSGDGSAWDSWPDLMRMYRGLSDPEDALRQQAAAEAAGPLDIEAGNSRTNLLHWLHSLRELGRVERSVTANTSCYAVFQKGARRTYLAWNLTGQSVEVRFSDGARLTVPAGKSARTSTETER